jgi:hypothetical protein
MLLPSAVALVTGVALLPMTCVDSRSAKGRALERTSVRLASFSASIRLSHPRLAMMDSDRVETLSHEPASSVQVERSTVASVRRLGQITGHSLQ